MLYNGYIYLSMLGLKLIHVSKGAIGLIVSSFIMKCGQYLSQPFTCISRSPVYHGLKAISGVVVHPKKHAYCLYLIMFYCSVEHMDLSISLWITSLALDRLFCIYIFQIWLILNWSSRSDTSVGLGSWTYYPLLGHVYRHWAMEYTIATWYYLIPV